MIITLDFFPFNEPVGKGKVYLPSEKLILKPQKKTFRKESPRKTKSSTDIDLDKLKPGKSKGYTIAELKEIAKRLKIKNSSSMNKKDLIKFILLELEKE